MTYSKAAVQHHIMPLVMLEAAGNAASLNGHHLMRVAQLDEGFGSIMGPSMHHPPSTPYNIKYVKILKYIIKG